ncbi:hypothetical protein RMATCC62417_08051 [Rhizopus microsporus]|nr:hypothetical protein RMATCC62417_08051 [Rhizopus microsporus]
MYKDDENIEAEISASQERTKQTAEQLIAYTFKYEAKNQATKMKNEKSLMNKQNLAAVALSKLRFELLNTTMCLFMTWSYLWDLSSNPKLNHLRKDYHTLDVHHKVIVTLDLNSIIALSFDSPDVQPTLFNPANATCTRK